MNTTSLAPISSKQIDYIQSQVERLELPSQKSSGSKTGKSSSGLSSFNYSPTIISVGGSKTEVHNHYGAGSSKKKEEEARAAWGVFAAIAAVVGTFFLGRAITDYDTSKEVHKAIGYVPAKLSLEQHSALHLVLSNVQDVVSNRLWAIANRIVFVAGTSLVVLAALTTGPMAIGAALVFGSLLSGALRLGLNGFEGRMSKNIEYGLSQLKKLPAPAESEPGFYMPGTFQQAYNVA